MKEKKVPFWHKIAIPFLGILIAYIRFVGWLVEKNSRLAIACGSTILVTLLAILHFSGVKVW